MSDKYQVVIVGGGTAGITTAAHMKNANPNVEIAIIEPSEKHYYQPLWTLVGGGVFDRTETERNEADLIPAGVTWVKDYVSTFAPDKNELTTKSGTTIGYEYLVVCAGIQLNWSNIDGLKDTLGQNGVCSNYTYDTVSSTWDNIRNLKNGTAIFTQPSTPIKCGGAPQKICYLAEEHFRRSGVRDNVEVVFASAKPGIFPVAKYAQALNGVVARKEINTKFEHELVELRPDKKEAVFVVAGDSDKKVVIKYDMIHVTPPMSAPDFLANSPLASAEGWVEVDKYHLNHVRYDNVFALGDCSNLPTSKTGAAIRKQAPTVAKNLLSKIAGEPMTVEYDGYTSCPLVTGYGSLILAEFDYDKQPMETFPFDQSQERYSMYALKAYGLPRLYWHGMLQGRA